MWAISLQENRVHHSGWGTGRSREVHGATGLYKICYRGSAATNLEAVLGLSPHDHIHLVQLSPTVQLGQIKSLLFKVNLP